MRERAGEASMTTAVQRERRESERGGFGEERDWRRVVDGAERYMEGK